MVFKKRSETGPSPQQFNASVAGYNFYQQPEPDGFENSAVGPQSAPFDKAHDRNQDRGKKMSQAMRTFGIRLKELIDEKSISVEELSEATKIRTILLEAIIKGQRENLPDDIFVVGYLKAVLTHLKVNPDPWIDEYKALSRPDAFPDPDTRGKSLTPVPEIHSKSHFFLWMLLVFSILICSGLYLFRFSFPDLLESIFGSKSSPAVPMAEKMRNGQEEINNPPTKTADQADKAETAIETRNLSKETVPEQNAGVIFKGLQLAAASSCWVELYGDKDQLLLRREITAGEKLDFQGKTFTIAIGDSSAIEIFYNGRSVEFEKAKGKVIKNLVIGGESK
jgi:cytoskeleton protein RodZ